MFPAVNNNLGTVKYLLTVRSSSMVLLYVFLSWNMSLNLANTSKPTRQQTKV